MAVTPEDVAQAKLDAKNKKNQEAMETSVYGKPVTLPGKPGDKSKPVNLPGKPTKAKFGEGMTNYRKGGYVSAADGCAKKGKTKGRIL